MVFDGGPAESPRLRAARPEPAPLVRSVIRWTHHGHQHVTKERALSEKEKLIADIMGAQIRLQHIFADDRSDPLFSSHLTMSQLKILLLLARHGTLAGGELARMVGVGAAALSGMIDRLVVQDLVTRTEDLNDRRVRRIGLTRAGSELIDGIITAGVAKQREILSRLSAEDLAVVSQATTILLREAGQALEEAVNRLTGDESGQV